MSQTEELSYRDAIQKASASITRFPLIPIRGVPLMSHIAQNWDSIWAFRPDPKDLLIATYPKAGRLLTQLHAYTVNLHVGGRCQTGNVLCVVTICHLWF